MKIYCSKHKHTELAQPVRDVRLGDAHSRVWVVTCPECLKEGAAEVLDSLKYASEPDPGRWDPESR